ncbi:MAG: double-transrane region domain protein [Gemmatimonadetes bacterium]|nr:double-transrane region domain protein [Gemmatimonadota bacterium]
MSFLAPLWLGLLVAAGVPLLLHLLRRRVGRRIEFPAARYLLRAEQENSRTLRLRNLLLMLLRVAIICALALAAARPLARLGGTGHAPTALAIVIDNSLSSGVVEQGRPLLTHMKELARAAVDAASPSDRLWLVTADLRVTGGSAAAIRAEIERITPLGGAGDPPAALARAAALVRGSGRPGGQVALLTDGQRSAWRTPPAIGDVPVVAWSPTNAPARNRAVTSVAARPIRWTPRGTVQARIRSADSTSWRLLVDGRVVARGSTAPDQEVSVRPVVTARGWVRGSLEIEPDELTGDDAGAFAAWIGSAPAVRVLAGAGAFAQSAVDALRAGGQVANGDATILGSAEEVTSLPALVTAPLNPVQLGAANRSLERLGIPWRFGAPAREESIAHGDGLDGATVSLHYPLLAQAGAAADTLATVGNTPWIVSGDRYVIVGSPLDPAATNLPLRAAFLPWLGRVIGERLGAEAGTVISGEPGALVTIPAGVDGLERPDGSRVAATAGSWRLPARPGVTFLTKSGKAVGALVANPQAAESELARWPSAQLAGALGARHVRTVSDAGALAALSFDAAAGRRSLVLPLLVVALLALVGEAVLTGGRVRRAA